MSQSTFLLLFRLGFYLVGSDGVRPIVDVEMVVAVELEYVESQHEPLEDGVRLECDHAVQVAFVFRIEDGSVYFTIQLLEIMGFT